MHFTPHRLDREIGTAMTALRAATQIPRDTLSDELGFNLDTLEQIESGGQPLLARALLWILDLLGDPVCLSKSDEDASTS